MPNNRMRLVIKIIIAFLLESLIMGLSQPVQAQTGGPLAPPEIPGEVIYVPFPVAIKLDGKLDDWKNIPVQSITKGPSPSKVAGEDGPLSFQVAADNEHFYLAMTISDKNIITGKHGTDYWNEDSLEFYMNTSGDLSASIYGPGIFQVNINPGDIGNTDPAKLTLTGVGHEQAEVKAFVFKTADGWGFEAAVPLKVKPAHGTEIGFQAQANGASTQDRDSKLIWSKADTSDNSWQSPSLFGRAMFVEVGRTDIPTSVARATSLTPAFTATPVPPVQKISVNQTGYYPGAPKYAVIASKAQAPIPWRLVDSLGNSMLEGQTTPFGNDAASGESIHLIDFSSFSKPGKGFLLQVGDVKSDPFEIGSSVYSTLKVDALRYFYLTRSGIELDKAHAGAWARPAGHLTDGKVTCYAGADSNGKQWPGCKYTLDASGGWYDAGDYGKYVVNGGISVWTLLNAYERNPKAFTDGTLNILESGNGVPDILDEARWEMKFLLGMQVPAGQPLAGMVHHKLHGQKWDPMPSVPPTSPDATYADGGRYLFPPSTAATLNLAATAAQCARIWKTVDPAFSARCLTAAETAWQAAVANPNIAAPSFSAGGGDYGDTDFTDEFYWAASELFVTTGKDTYKDYLLASKHFAGAKDLFWGDTTALGTISLALIPNKLPAEKVKQCQQSIIDSADEYVQILKKQGYQIPILPNSYTWGSNSDILNRMMVMGLAYDFTKEQVYLDSMLESMDYLLGRNPLNKSYISGYGTDPLTHPHHRFWANQPDKGFPPPPPGVVSGGPNGSPADPVADAAKLSDNPPAKSYLDKYGSFSTNEVAINWNAPLAWVTAYLDDTARPLFSKEQTAATPTPTLLSPSPSPTTVIATPTPTPVAETPPASNPWSIVISTVVILGLIVGAVIYWRQRQSKV